MSDLVGNPEDRFSHFAAHFKYDHFLHTSFMLKDNLVSVGGSD